jgi:hypothetical protein
MIALLMATAAVAAPPATNDEAARRALNMMGNCIANQTPWTARAVLAMDYRTPEYQEKLKTLGTGVGGRCLRYRSRLSSSGVLLAGALAEGMLHSQYKKKELPLRIAYDPARALIEARSVGEEMALCTAMKAPQVTADLLQTEPSTPAEDERIAALGPVLGECLQQGAKVEMNKPAIRAMLALAAWRVATTPRKSLP